ncbi:MAG TPA: hypothetical protein VF753_04375 [Terriglobales bacterium]
MRSMQVFVRVTICLLAMSLTAVLSGCGLSSNSSSITTNPVPTLSSISPKTAVVGNAPITITATGSNFITYTEIMWNGLPLKTTFVSSSVLKAQVPAADLQNSAIVAVTVSTPAPGGGVSAARINFTVAGQSNPLPSLNSINPTFASAGSPATGITVSGANFISSSAVTWNGSPLATTYNSATSLSAQVPAADLATAGVAEIAVKNPAPGGGSSGNIAFTIESSSNPVPSLASISPTSAALDSPAITLTATGSNYLPLSVIQWNGAALTTSFVNGTTLTAQVPASDLTTGGNAAVTVMTPAPGGGTSASLNFSIGTGTRVVNTLASDLAWDPVNSVIYLSLPSTDSTNPNSVQILNPTTAALGTAVSGGSEPFLLSVSATSQYLYVSQNGASTVQVMNLPSLSSNSTIQLGTNPSDGPYHAMDLQAAPNADSTVAVVLGTPGYSPEEEGGVVIYQGGAALANPLCGWGESGCPNNSYQDLFDSIQWGSDATAMYAANNESSSFNFYTVPVGSTGFGTVTAYTGVFTNYFDRIHYDAPTGYIYDDGGQIVNPATGTVVGTFSASGLMVPDGTLGAAFFLGQTQPEAGTTTYTLESFDIHALTPISTFNIENVVGLPTQMIRWGSNGLAFITIDRSQSPPTGAVYVVTGTFISSAEVRRNLNAVENVHRTWTPESRLSHASDSTKASTK